MTWLVVKAALKKVYVWLKHNWKVPLLIAWSLFIFIASRRNTEALKGVLEANKKAHREEIDILNKSHREEIIKLKNLQQQYEDTILELEKEFEVQNRKLSEKHIEDVKEIVIKSRGNPEEIIRKIENDFGIKFKK